MDRATPFDNAVASAAGVGEASLDSPDGLEALLGRRRVVYIAPPCPPTTDCLHAVELQPADPEAAMVLVAHG